MHYKKSLFYRFGAFVVSPKLFWTRPTIVAPEHQISEPNNHLQLNSILKHKKGKDFKIKFWWKLPMRWRIKQTSKSVILLFVAFACNFFSLIYIHYHSVSIHIVHFFFNLIGIIVRLNMLWIDDMLCVLYCGLCIIRWLCKD